jgi:hypothetical protein
MPTISRKRKQASEEERASLISVDEIDEITVWKFMCLYH